MAGDSPGLARAARLEEWLRDLRVAPLVEGSSEMLRSQVASPGDRPAVRPPACCELASLALRISFI
jgi:hypothetical protein